MSSLSESSEIIEDLAEAVKTLFSGPSRKYRYNADEYQIVVVQAVGNNIMQGQYHISRYVLDTKIEGMALEHICRSLDRELLDKAGFVGKHRLWGSSPVIDGMPIRHQESPNIYVLNGPHGGNYYRIPSPGYTFYIPTKLGFNAEYSTRLSTLGWVGVYAGGAYA